MAERAGGWDAALDLDAETALGWLADILDGDEIQAYQQALQVWGAKTAGADPDAARKCLPPKPPCLQNEWGE